MDVRHPRSAPLAGAVLLVLVATACSVNPATGRRQLVLVGEQQEVAMGRQYDQQLSVELGLYPDDALGQYVSSIGRRLAALSERPKLAWTFRVVDDPVVNAFALPGGYIYVTRGILAHFDSEAELASVLGHEIGHVTARHSVNQMSKAQLAQLGLGATAILAPDRYGQFGGLAETVVGLGFLKFSRDDERQADDLGLRYLVRAGYDPRPMADVFDTLRRVSEASGSGRLPGLLSTHPHPENREQRIEQQIAALGRDFSRSPTNRDALLDRLDGIVFGEDPRQGYFRDREFFHPEMRFRLEFPAGWTTLNARAAVAGGPDAKDALVQLTLAREAGAAEGWRVFAGQEGITAAGSWRPALRGLTAAGGEFRVSGEQALQGRVAFVEHEGRVFRLLGIAAEARWSAYVDELTRSVESFGPLSDPRALAVQPKRLAVVRPDTPMDLAGLARRYQATVPVETLARINRLDPATRVEPGRAYKVVRGGELP